MGKKIYKYFSACVIDLVFHEAGICGIKCSLPKDYNDPYELFLGIDLTVSPDLLATYNDIIQELPQYPTSCFSNSPTVTPMWAHYANNHSGFVLEFDVDHVYAAFDNIIIRDVAYKDQPSSIIAGRLEMAAGTKKPRHAYLLQQAVFNEAYFSKATSWSYEQESRLLDQEGYCVDVAGNMILKMPLSCCSAIIIGKNANSADVERSKEISAESDLRWFQAVIGRSNAQPFFIDQNTDRLVFNGSEIVASKSACESCQEPLANEGQYCPWCSVTDRQAMNAASGNPLRVLDKYNLLEGYYEQMGKITRSHSSK